MGRLITLTFLATIYLSVWSIDKVNKQERKLYIKKLENCKGSNYTMLWSNDPKITYQKEKKQYYLNVDLEVKEEVSTNFAISFTFLKCDSSGNPDSCEYLIKEHKIENICKFVNMKNQAWSEFMEFFDNEIICPIKPGIYHLQNWTINNYGLGKMPLKDGIWKLHIIGFDNGKTIACNDVEIKIITVRVF